MVKQKFNEVQRIDRGSHNITGLW